MTVGDQYRRILTRVQGIARQGANSDSLRMGQGQHGRHKLPQLLRVVYYPAFDESGRLADHLNRTRWYLPGRIERRTSVVYATSSNEFLDTPEPDHSPAYSDEGMQFESVKEGDLSHVCKGADLVLVWKSSFESAAKKLVRGRAARVVNVDIDDIRSVEYGVQAKLLWSHTPKVERMEILNQSQARLIDTARSFRQQGRKFALVLGTGPSFSQYRTISRDQGIVIACNSAVSDRDFLETFEPDFVTFGDAAHHLGPSHQAAEFRNDLVRALQLVPTLHLVANAAYYPLLQPVLKDHTERCIWIEQTSERPVLDLTDDFALPQLDSVMNSVMLPLATTLSKIVFILGADGFSTSPEDNEDFWGHAKSFNYISKISSSHAAHPTYAHHRMRGVNGRPPTHIRHLQSAQETVSTGQRNNFQYVALMESSIPAFRSRKISDEEWRGCVRDGRLSLEDLARQLSS